MPFTSKYGKQVVNDAVTSLGLTDVGIDQITLDKLCPGDLERNK